MWKGGKIIMNDVTTLILAVQKWSFEDEKTKQLRQGVTVHLVPLGQPSTDENTLGIRPMKYTLTLDEYARFVGFRYPAMAKVDFGMNFTNGKISPVDFKDIKTINIADLMEVI